jgi:hypothetical protein
VSRGSVGGRVTICPPVAVWRAGAPAEQHPQTRSRSKRHLIARHREEWRGQKSSTSKKRQCKPASRPLPRHLTCDGRELRQEAVPQPSPPCLRRLSSAHVRNQESRARPPRDEQNITMRAPQRHEARTNSFTNLEVRGMSKGRLFVSGTMHQWTTYRPKTVRAEYKIRLAGPLQPGCGQAI